MNANPAQPNQIATLTFRLPILGILYQTRQARLLVGCTNPRRRRHRGRRGSHAGAESHRRVAARAPPIAPRPSKPNEHWAFVAWHTRAEEFITVAADVCDGLVHNAHVLTPLAVAVAPAIDQIGANDEYWHEEEGKRRVNARSGKKSCSLTPLPCSPRWRFKHLIYGCVPAPSRFYSRSWLRKPWTLAAAAPLSPRVADHFHSKAKKPTVVGFLSPGAPG